MERIDGDSGHKYSDAVFNNGLLLTINNSIATVFVAYLVAPLQLDYNFFKQ